MAVEFTVKLAGLLKADDVAVVYNDGNLKALAINKAIIVTDGDVNEWLPEDAAYIVSNIDGDGVDEVIDLSDSGIKHQDRLVRAIQSAAQMALIVSDPGPLGAKFLAKLVADDVLAERNVKRGLRRAGAQPAKNQEGDKPKGAKGWYKAADGGWTSDPKQAAKKVS